MESGPIIMPAGKSLPQGRPLHARTGFLSHSPINFYSRKENHRMDLLRRFLRLARGFLGLFIGGLEEQSPEALLEAAKQDYRRRVAQYHQSLARIAGVGERLKLQIEDKVTKSKILDQRILANLKAGNSERPGALAREL